MKIDITTKEQEPMFHRTKIEASMVFEKATPSMAEVRGEIASQLKKDQKLVVVRKIGNAYGHKSASIAAYAYDDEAVLNTVELNLPKEEEKKEEPKADAPAEKKEEKTKAKEEAPAKKEAAPEAKEKKKEKKPADAEKTE